MFKLALCFTFLLTSALRVAVGGSPINSSTESFTGKITQLNWDITEPKKRVKLPKNKRKRSASQLRSVGYFFGNQDY